MLRVMVKGMLEAVGCQTANFWIKHNVILPVNIQEKSNNSVKKQLF